MEPARHDLATEEEYLARELLADTKHEYINGEIVAMAGASPRHNLIAANITGALRDRLRGRPCLVFPSDQRVGVVRTTLYTYPDIAVVCGRPEFHAKDRNTLVNPTVLIEILSDTTGAYDRGAKFAHYRKLGSLREYLLVEQSERRVDHFRRGESAEWVLTAFEEEASVSLPALGLTLPLAEIYEKLELLDPAP